LKDGWQPGESAGQVRKSRHNGTDMFRSFGAPELVVVGVLVMLLFGGSWLAKAGRLAGEKVKQLVLRAKWLWASATGSEEEALEKERAFGQELAREVMSEYPAPVAEVKQALVERIGARLSAQRKAPWPFSFRVVSAPVANAFALPGGFVFVYEPLLDMLGADDDALAFVLAHEMAHVLLGHAREAQLRRLLLGRITARAGGVGQIAERLLTLAYSREDELEADREAVSIIKSAGFNTAGAAAFFSRSAGVESSVLEYLSTHPPAKERLKAVQAQASAT